MELVLFIGLTAYVAILVLVLAVCRAAAVGDSHVAREPRRPGRGGRRRSRRARVRGDTHDDARRRGRIRAG
jgi:hypothetical protein